MCDGKDDGENDHDSDITMFIVIVVLHSLSGTLICHACNDCNTNIQCLDIDPMPRYCFPINGLMSHHVARKSQISGFLIEDRMVMLLLVVTANELRG